MKPGLENQARSDVGCDDAHALVRKGEACYARGELTAAQAAFEGALELQHDLTTAHHALGRIHLRNDRLEEAADSLQMAVHFDPCRFEAHADLAIVLARQGHIEMAHAALNDAMTGGAQSSAVLSACARAFKALGDLQGADGCFVRSLEIEPHSADIHCQLGYVRFLAGQYDASRRGYEDALQIDVAHVAALHNLGLLELETGFCERALRCFERAYAFRPSVETLACIGHALRDLGRLDEAVASYERALIEDPSFGDARINLAYALLMRGHLAAGWREYEKRFEATATRQRDFGLPMWRGEALHDRRLLIFAEQGLGDEIMFASCIPDAIDRAAGCVIECSARLERLFARSFPRACVHGGEKNDSVGWLRTLPACDFQVPIGSLPGYFRQADASFPARQRYLMADPLRIEYWRRMLRADDRVRIGIAWRGGALRSRQFLRSIPLDRWSDLLRRPECRFIALQHGGHGDELRRVVEETGVDVMDLSNVCSDIDELAAVTCALDLIVTVDNTLAHLGGALGKPTWVLLPAIPEWRYPREGSRMPWYPSMRLFRQSAPQGWEHAFGAIEHALSAQKAAILAAR